MPMKKIYLLFLFVSTHFLFSQNGEMRNNATESGNYFIKNEGQIADQNGKPNTAVRYLLNTPGLNVQLRATGFSYDFYEFENRERLKEHMSMDPSAGFSLLQDTTSIKKNFHRIDFDFLNANEAVIMKEYEASASYTNYFNLPFTKDGVKNVHSYRKIVYENLYPNINLEFYVPEDKSKPVEYNFIVLPGGSLQDIQMKISGADVQVEKDKIRMQLAFGEMNETIPGSWLQSSKGKEEIAIHYSLIGHNTIGFTTNQKTTPSTTLTIDPVPVRLWGSYFGGEGGEYSWVNRIVLDNDGYIYGVSNTTSTTNIATTGAYQTTFPDSPIAFVAGFFYKMTPDGQLLWSTYCFNVVFMGDAVDNNQDVIVTGFTSGADPIITPGVYQADFNDAFDGLVVKFNPSGFPIWGTYYGGENSDICHRVAIDSNNNICIVGMTGSLTGIASPGAYQEHGTFSEAWFQEAYPNGNNYSQSFILKLNTNGNRLWSTYYGGYNTSDVAVDSNNNIYLLGRSMFFLEDLSTEGAFLDLDDASSDPVADVVYNGFLAKFSASGQRLWGTYFGGTETEFNNYAFGVAVDHNDNVIVCGSTTNPNLATTDAYQPEILGYKDGYLAKFEPDGTLLFCTYYGGESYETLNGVTIDEYNNMYVCGGTSSNTSIASTNAFQPAKANLDDAMLVKFNNCGERIWGTYYGGNNGEIAESVAYNNGHLCMVGHTLGSTNLGTPGVHQENFYGGDSDLFLVKFSENEQLPDGSLELTPEEVTVCEGNTLTLNVAHGDIFSWSGPNGFTSNQQTIHIPDAEGSDAGTYTVIVQEEGNCNTVRKFEVGVMNGVQDISTIRNLYACEDTDNPGYSVFDTSGIQDQLLNGQTDVAVTYFDEAGNPLPSPLPNPMENYSSLYTNHYCQSSLYGFS